MYKKIVLVILIFSLIFSFSPASKAVVGEAIQSQIPQPVYSTPNGMELEKLMKWARTIEELYTVTTTLKDTLEQDQKNSAVINALLGNKDLMQVYKEEDLADKDVDEWEEWVANDINSVFTGTANKLQYMEDISEDLEPEKKEETEKEVSREVGEGTDPVMKEFISRSGEPTDDNTSSMSNQESFEFYLEELKKRHDKSKENIEKINYKYGNENEPIPGSTTHFIAEEKENINNINENINENIDKQSISLAVKSLNKIQMENTRINLMILEALKDLNKQISRIESRLHQESLKEEFQNIKRSHNY